jgi:hypothetical protein
MNTSSRPSPRAGSEASREPSWPRVLVTTVRLWLTRRRVRKLHLAALVVIIALAAGLVLGLALGASGGAGPTRAADPAAAAAASEAADWVAGQVSHDTTVACDPAMCTLLQRRGFPASNLDLIRAGTHGPVGAVGAGLVVTTAALRGALGRALAAQCAPVVLADFGTGADRVTVQPIAPDGPAAYLAGFRADQATRRSVGAQLLLNPGVAADPLARRQLAEGLADSRLIATITMLAALHPVHLVSFGDASPGASQGVALRSVLLSAVTNTSVTDTGGTRGLSAGPALLASMRALLLGQQSLYRPAVIQTVRLGAGQRGLRIVFAAPGPLGLLDASQPLVKIGDVG